MAVAQDKRASELTAPVSIADTDVFAGYRPGTGGEPNLDIRAPAGLLRSIPAGAILPSSVSRLYSDKLAERPSIADLGGDFQTAIDETRALVGTISDGTTVINANFKDQAAAVLYLGPGIYDLSELTAAFATSGSGTKHVHIKGESPFHTFIRIPDGQYFIDNAENLLSLFIEGVQFIGGLGAVALRNDSSYSRGLYAIRNCVFSGFTEAAILCLSANFGRFVIEHNYFYAFGTDSTDITGIGIAWAGYTDNNIIRHNYFHKCKYGIKIGRGNTRCLILENSFLRNATGYGQTDIWILPETGSPSDNFGDGSVITHNRFGNENVGVNDYRILIADENTGVGTHFGNRPHSTSASTNRWRGHIIRDNLCWGGTGVTKAFVVSLTADIRGHHFCNKLLSMPGEFAIEVTTAVASYTTNAKSIVDLSLRGDESSPTVNAPNWHGLVLARDPHGILAGSLTVPQYFEGGDDPSFVELIGPGTTWAVGSSCTISSTTDSAGGSLAQEVTYTANGSASATTARARTGTVALSSTYTDRLGWIELEIKQSDTLPITLIDLKMVPSAGAWLFMSPQIRVPTVWTTVRFPFICQEYASISLGVCARDYSSGVAEKVKVGRVRVYLAKQPVNYSPLRSSGPSKLTAPSVGAAAAIPGAPAKWKQEIHDGGVYWSPLWS